MRLQEKINTVVPSAIKDDWLGAVNRLIGEVADWSSERGWAVQKDETDIREEGLGLYAAPVLTVDTEKGRVIIEPVARDVFGAQGRVDFYAYPTYFRVMLLHQVDEESPEWTVRTDSGIDWPHDWSKEEFFALVKALLRRQ